MGVDTAPRSPFPASRSPASGDNQSAHAAPLNQNHVPTEAELTSLFDEAMKRAPGGPDPVTGKGMTKDEQTKFLKAMGDPEFRSLLNDYMLEIADPANRAETEQYLAQLEREQKVPEDKTLIKPTPGFVVKTKWTSGGDTKKMFVNICSSEKLQPPSSTKVESGPRVGTSWSLPYSVGPERTEPDKSGASRVVTYDVCFHPRTLEFATAQKQYRDMVVKTCLDAVEPLVRKSHSAPDAVMSRDYHVLKGVLYKSGEPVTMCLTTPVGGGATGTEKVGTPTNRPAKETVKAPLKTERLEPKPASPSAEDSRKEILHETRAAKKPLIEEVTATAATTVPTATSPPRPLPKLEFRVVYRGKFEMLDHMHATLNSHETPAQLPNRPRELVVEISFPNHSSAKGIDLDVNDRAVKVETTGYEPLEVQLPFAVIEEKGSAKFDKKARKLIVTLPVQPPEPAPVKRMAIVEQDEDEAEDEVQGRMTQMPAQTSKEVPPASEAKKKSVYTATDDAFGMLRETALMVANDPMYLPRKQPIAPNPSTHVQEVREVPSDPVESVSLEDKVKAHVANDMSYDDLPPLESWSEDEDEDDIEMDLEDMFAMDMPVAKGSLVAPDASATPDASTEPAVETRILRQTPTFTTKETAACLSYLIDVAHVDSASVKLEFPSKSSFVVQFSAQHDQFELRVDDLAITIDEARSEFHAATDNLVVILHKVSSDGAQAEEIEQLAHTPAPPPVVRFQNDLLYDID